MSPRVSEAEVMGWLDGPKGDDTPHLAGHADSEQWIVGRLLTDADETWPILGDLAPASLTTRKHQLILGAALRLRDANEPVDESTVASTLRAAGMLEEAGGREYVRELGCMTPTTPHLGWHVARVREASRRRKQLVAADRLRTVLGNGCDPESVRALTAELQELEHDERAATGFQSTPLADLLAQPDPPILERVPGLLYENDRAFIAAPPKSGKTLLGRTLALCLAAGCPFIGIPVVGGAVPVLWLDLEEGVDWTRVGFRQLARGLGLPAMPGLHVLSRTGVDLLAQHDAIAAEIVRTGARVVFMDTLRRMMPTGGGLSEKDSELAASVGNAIDAMRTAVPWPLAVVVLAHTVKNRESGGNPVTSIRGSGDFGAFADTIIELTGDDPEEGIRLAVVRRHGKRTGRHGAPIVAKLEERPDGGLVLVREQDPVAGLSAVDTLAVVLGRAPVDGLDRGDLETALRTAGLSARQVDPTIARAIAEGVAVASPVGRRKLYRLGSGEVTA